MKQSLFALFAAVIAKIFVWCLSAAQHLVVTSMTPFAGVFALLVGIILLVILFIVLMRRMETGMRGWGFEGYSPTFLFAGLVLFFNAAVMLMNQLEGRFWQTPKPEHNSVWLEWDKVGNLALWLLLPGQIVFLFNLIYSAVRKKKSI